MSDAPTLTKTLLNGVKLNCPSCGAGEIFASYLKRRDACPHCGESFVGLDADDGPAWLTIGIAAHIVDISETSLRKLLSTPHGNLGRAKKMPNPQLADFQIDKVVAYLLSLKGGKGSAK